jgi:hypothetical protein
MCSTGLCFSKRLAERRVAAVCKPAIICTSKWREQAHRDLNKALVYVTCQVHSIMHRFLYQRETGELAPALHTCFSSSTDNEQVIVM